MIYLRYIFLIISLSSLSQVQNLSEVVVSAQIINSLYTPLSLSKIKNDSIKKNLTTDIGNKLKNVPSLFVSSQQNYSQDTRISIRGFGTRAPFGIRGIKILLDGIPITTPDGQSQLDHIPQSIIGDIEVIRGISSGLYGNASGGVIMIKSIPLKKRFYNSISFADFNTKQIDLLIDNQSENGQVRFGFEHKKSLGYRKWSGHENSILYLSGKKIIFNDKTIKFNYSLFNSPFAADAGSLTLEEVFENRRQGRLRNINYKAGEKINQHHFSSSLNYKNTKTYLFYSKRKLDASLPFNYGGQIDLNRDFFGLGFQKKSIYKNLNFHYGIDLQGQEDLRKRFRNIEGVRGEMTLNQNESFYTSGFFAIIEKKISNIIARVSFRQDFHKIKFDDFNNGGNGEKDISIFSPNLSLNYNISNSTSTYVRFGTGFETPSLNELSANPNRESGFNNELKSQNTKEIEFGLKTKTKKFKSSFVLFSSRTTNEILPYEIDDYPGQNFYSNTGKVNRKGLEIEGEYNFGFSQILFSYNLGKYKTHEKFNLPNVPSQKLGMIFNTKFKKVNLSFFANYVGKRYADNLNKVVIDEFTTANVNLSYLWDNFSINLDIINLTNVKYYDNIRINAFGGRYYEPAPKRHLAVSLIMKM